MCPDYLVNLLPLLVSETNPYHRRRLFERNIPRCNTETYKKSFIPSATVIWNSLPNSVKNCSSLSALKRCLSAEDPVIPPYFYSGSRKEQVIHCQLRNNMSDLKSDLFIRHLIDDPTCTCGAGQETAEHYLLSCALFNDFRVDTINSLPLNCIQTRILLNGDTLLPMDTNFLVFSTVQKFILLSGRF